MKWTYRLSIPKGTTAIPFDPYFVNAPGLLSSNRTHGKKSVKAAIRTLSIQVVETMFNKKKELEAKVLIEGEPYLLPPLRFVGIRLISFQGRKFFGLEIHGLFKNKPDALRIGSLLARISATQPLQTQEVVVPAGTYQAVHSQISHRRTHAHTEIHSRVMGCFRSWHDQIPIAQ